MHYILFTVTGLEGFSASKYSDHLAICQTTAFRWCVYLAVRPQSSMALELSYQTNYPFMCNLSQGCFVSAGKVVFAAISLCSRHSFRLLQRTKAPFQPAGLPLIVSVMFLFDQLTIM